jgi:hypothetical protein
LQDYQVDLLASLKPRPNMFFAYDPGDAFETLESAARRLLDAGFTTASHRMRLRPDRLSEGHVRSGRSARLQQMVGIGFTPHAMLWQPETPVPGEGTGLRLSGVRFNDAGRARPSSMRAPSRARQCSLKLRSDHAVS